MPRNTKRSGTKGTFKEINKPDKYFGLIANLNLVIDLEPSTFAVWEYVMIEEYESILKNDVWAMFQRPHDKSMVTSNGFIR
jgi:hypothetical protein